MDRARAVRNIANVVNGSTPVGLVIAVSTGARLRIRDGLVVADRARLGWLRASAMTIGSVVLVPRHPIEDVERRIPGILGHEDAHAWQYAYCLGLPFLPLYGVATLWSLWRSRDRALANLFEVQADLAAGGYVPGAKGASGSAAAPSGRPGGRHVAGGGA